MHTHIIINKDLGLHLVIHSDSAEIDLVDVLDEMILKQFCHATEGV